MLKIVGKLLRKERVKVDCPVDGVHRAGADNKIKGAHNFYIGDKIVFHGMVGFYWQLDDNWGLKIYCSPKTGYCRNKKYVRQCRNRMKKYSAIAPRVGPIEKVYVDLTYKEKHYKKWAWAIKVEHMQWTDAWIPYTNGYPYDWDADEHPDHSPAGFIKFKNKVNKTLSQETKKVLDKIGDSYKLGDIIWSRKKKCWKMVDFG